MNEDTQFTRREFTTTVHLDDIVEELAERYYQGNVIMFLRAAIEDHRSSLTKTQQSHSFTPSKDAPDSPQPGHDPGGTPSKSEPTVAEYIARKTKSPDTELLPGGARMVYQYLCSVGEPVSADALRSDTNLSQRELRSGIENLLDTGVIVRTRDNTSKFKLAGTSQSKHSESW